MILFMYILKRLTRWDIRKYDDKIKAIELIDDLVIGPVAEGLEQAGEDYRMLILPDHPTPVRVRTHTGDPVPYMLYDSTNAVKGQDEYSERTAQKTGDLQRKRRPYDRSSFGT